MPYQVLQAPADLQDDHDAIDQEQFTRNNRLFAVAMILAAFAAAGGAVLLSLA